MAQTFEKIVTPLGELQWVFITGMGKDNFNKDGYIYSADIILGADEGEALAARIEEFFKEQVGTKAKAKSLGFKENDEGELVFTFKTSTTKRDKSPKTIIVGDAKGKKMEMGDRKIANGSTGVIMGAMGIYEQGTSKGVSLYLNGVQLKNFIPYEDDAGMADLGEGYEEPEMEAMDY